MPYDDATTLNDIAQRVHVATATWWHDPLTGERLTRNRGEMLALIHSEVSECLEGERKGLMDDHIAHRKMAEVELADIIIRVFDYAAGYGYDIGGAFVDKMRYNAQRADHKPEARIAENGKQF